MQKANLKLGPGKVSLQQGNVYIGTSNGSVEILSLQLEGKPEMDAKSFANGYKAIDGANV